MKTLLTLRVNVGIQGAVNFHRSEEKKEKTLPIVKYTKGEVLHPNF